MLVDQNRSWPRTTSVTPLQGVVDDDGKVIARRHLLAREHDIAPRLRRGGDEAGLALRPDAGLRPGQHAGARHCRVHGEPQRERLAGAAAALALGRRHFAGAAGIKRHAVGIARPTTLAGRARRPARRSRCGSRSSDRAGPALRAWRWRLRSRRNARSAAAPAPARRCRASADPRRSPPRIPAGSAAVSISSMRSNSRPPNSRAMS